MVASSPVSIMSNEVTRHKTCAESVKESYARRMEDIRLMYTDSERHGELCEYGLSIDYVEPGTWHKGSEGYKRYQLSWGGPSEEFRVYNDGRVEFWYLDWFDGASVPVTGSDAEIIKDIVTPS